MNYLGKEFIPINECGLSIEEMQDFESKYLITIPNELKALFGQINDSILEYPIVDTSEIEGGVMPERWVGIAENGMNHMLEFYGESLGENMLPFARDPGGNLFGVKMIDGIQNGVYYIDLNEFLYESGKRVYKTYRLSDNIRDLINLIRQ